MPASSLTLSSQFVRKLSFSSIYVNLYFDNFRQYFRVCFRLLYHQLPFSATAAISSWPEALFNLPKRLLVQIVRHQRYCRALSTESSGASDPVLQTYAKKGSEKSHKCQNQIHSIGKRTSVVLQFYQISTTYQIGFVVRLPIPIDLEVTLYNQANIIDVDASCEDVRCDQDR